MRLLFHRLLVPVLVFGCAIAAMWLPLPRSFPPALSGGRNQMAAIATGLVLLSNLLWLAGYAVNSRVQYNSAVDWPLVSQGLEAKSYMLFGRQYRGTLQGRQVDVTFVRGRWRDFALNIIRPEVR